MNRYWSGLVAAGAMATTVALGAQNSPNPANTPPADAANPPGVQRAPATPSAQERTPNTVTISGCIANAPAMTATAGDRGSTAGAGAAGREATAGGNAAAGGAVGAGNTTGATAGAGATAGMASGFVLNSARITAGGDANRAVGTTGTAATSYRLEGETATISPHLNHRVEITGRLQSSAASPTGAANAAAGSTAATPTLRVESVRMLAETCDAAATPAPTQNRNPGGGNQNTPGNQGGNAPPQR